MSSLYLIRHGQASFGSKNYDVLSPLGILQSALLGEYALEKQMQFDAVLSGKLERQIDTFRHFSKSYNYPLPLLESHSAFNEHQVTEIFNRELPAFAFRNPEILDAMQKSGKHKPPVKKELTRIFFKIYIAWVNGELDSGSHEGWQMFKKRVITGISLLEALLNKHNSVVLFTSGGTISVIIGYVLGLTDLKMAELNWQVRNSSISELSFSRGKFYLRGFNAVPHLRESEMITYT